MADSERSVSARQRAVQRILSRIELFESFNSGLADGFFDRSVFWEIRNSTMSQADWADHVGVSQGTIGNWERGVTRPDAFYRRRLLAASSDILSSERKRARTISSVLGLGVQLDLFDTKKKLNDSILNAALTDFDFDKHTGKIVPIPFSSDDRVQSIEELEEDKQRLLDSLSEQADIIITGISEGANIESKRFIDFFDRYRNAATSQSANPRLLHRIGEIIARRTSSDDVRAAVSGWDEAAIDGFNSDHQELMRLYFRAALAKAQEVEALPITEDSIGDDAGESFFKAADLLETATKEDGQRMFDTDISTLLRDIGGEVRNLREAEQFTLDDNRRAILRRRRLIAIKNGSIYIGRVLFFASLFIVMSPQALGAVGSVASILGLMDAVSPGSVRHIYEKLRQAFPILPQLTR